jgi:hypothetical protein
VLDVRSSNELTIALPIGLSFQSKQYISPVFKHRLAHFISVPDLIPNTHDAHATSAINEKEKAKNKRSRK